MLEKDKEKKRQEREATLSERVPPLLLSGLSMQDLQVCAGHCIKQQGSNAPHETIPLMYIDPMHIACLYEVGALEDR